MQVTTRVDALRLEESERAHLMHPGGTFVYFCGTDELVVVDAGDEAWSAQVLGYLEQRGNPRVSHVLVTHGHQDHFGGAAAIREKTGAVILGHPDVIANLKERLGQDGVRGVKDGEVVEAGGMTFDISYTPGHADDHIGIFLRGDDVLFTGDTILGIGTVTMHDLYDYMRSLERLKAFPARYICPGHGPVVPNPQAKIQEYIDHRNMREEQVVQSLRHGKTKSWDMVKEIYADVDERLHRAAEGNVLTHLRKLEKEGRVIRHEGEPPTFALVE